MSQGTVYRIPKIKRSQVLLKLVIDPSDITKGLPKCTLPELTDKGMILSMIPQKVPLAKLSHDGTLKICMKYYADNIQLIDKYVEVKVIDDYGDFWVGSLFGLTVRGSGGEGIVRGCKVIGIEGQTIVVEYLIEGGNENWKKFQGKIYEILNKKQ